MSGAGWLALVVLVAFLAAAVAYGIWGWNLLGDVELSTFGWFALVVGSAVTLLVGGGLMALVFYSSRHDMDR